MTAQRIRDSLANFLTGLGAANPKTTANTYLVPAEIAAQQIETAFRGSTWYGKLTEIPADDATREWRTWHADADQVTQIEATERRFRVQSSVRRALVWARMYGGAGILLGGPPGEDATKPIDPARLPAGWLRYLTVLPKHMLPPANGLQQDPMSPYYGQPELYRLSGTGSVVDVHASRVLRFIGNERGADMVGDGWGDSTWLRLGDAVTNADTIAAVLAGLMQEAKTDIVSIQDLLGKLMDSEGTDLLIKRFQTAQMLKSNSSVTILDQSDEWNQRQIVWTGLPDVARTLLTIMAGAADIPLTRVLGTSAQGLNATGEGDLKNYYDNVRSKQTNDIGPTLAPLDEILISTALGSRPKEIWYEWAPLWQPTDKERAEVNRINAEADRIYVETGLVSARSMSEPVQTRMIESGLYPGLVPQTIEDDGGEIEPTETETDDPAVIGDAAPRTLYVSRRVLNAAAIRSHYRAHGVKGTLAADDMHVTVIYSRHPVDWIKAGTDWNNREDGGLTIAAGGPRVNEVFGDALVLSFASTDLAWRHRSIQERTGATHDYDYQPHVTFAYGTFDVANVPPYTGAIELGPEVFAEIDPNWRSGLTLDKRGSR